MITIDKSWDLSATIQMFGTDQTTYEEKQSQTKLPGRFDPSIATPEQIQTIGSKLTGFTTNTYIDTLLTAQKNINQIEGN